MTFVLNSTCRQILELGTKEQWPSVAAFKTLNFRKRAHSELTFYCSEVYEIVMSMQGVTIDSVWEEIVIVLLAFFHSTFS
eukprot:scaffold18886_cov108-Cylindrotheca_fusiformis.AAC.1